MTATDAAGPAAAAALLVARGALLEVAADVLLHVLGVLLLASALFAGEAVESSISRGPAHQQ